jgi:hypothetical protein
MDLTDIWQEHKKFILAIAAALLVWLIGKGTLNANYDVDSVAGRIRSIDSGLRRKENIKASTVSGVRTEVEGLRARLTELVQEMDFRPDEVFVLPPGEPNPTSHCWSTIRYVQKVLVDEAERLDIRVPEKLGLDNAAPTDREEIRRTLRALNIIHNVVLSCIQSGVRSVQRIRIEDEAKRRAGGTSFVSELRVEFEIHGSEKSLRSVIGSLVEDPKDGSSTFLEIATPTHITPSKDQPGLMRLQLSVAGLAISSDDLELEDA